jgi:hypothetical protein
MVQRVPSYLTPNCVSLSADQLPASFDYLVVSGILVTVMALVLLATVSYHCAATWRWLRGLGRDTDGSTEDALAKQAAIMISHSLPDLKTEPIRKEYVQDPKDGKKVNFRELVLRVT